MINLLLERKRKKKTQKSVVEKQLAKQELAERSNDNEIFNNLGELVSPFFMYNLHSILQIPRPQAMLAYSNKTGTKI